MFEDEPHSGPGSIRFQLSRASLAMNPSKSICLDPDMIMEVFDVAKA